ncbi:uncharacterized protein METZ01_LOCUS199381, partial [marine metagenome]
VFKEITAYRTHSLMAPCPAQPEAIGVVP